MISAGHTRTALASITNDAERARLVACGSDGARSGYLPIGPYRLAAQLRIVKLFDRRNEPAMST